jgi:hypothetical protein
MEGGTVWWKERERARERASERERRRSELAYDTEEVRRESESDSRGGRVPPAYHSSFFITFSLISNAFLLVHSFPLAFLFYLLNSPIQKQYTPTQK